MSTTDSQYYRDDDVTLWHADCRHLPLPDDSIDLVVTSPPYFDLRTYEDQGDACKDQIGAEPTAADYIKSLVGCTFEWLRVLKPTGSLWVNLGDKYDTSGSLMLLPERYRVALADEGLLVRAVTVWDKGARGGWSDKAADRVRRSHEDWVHVTAQRRYHADLDALRQAPEADYRDRPQYRRAVELFDAAGFGPEHLAAVRAVGVIDSRGGQVRSGGRWTSDAGRLAAEVRDRLRSYYRELCGSSAAPRGRTPGSVWQVPTVSLKPPAELGLVNNFASFPPEIVSRIVTGWSPDGGVVLDPMCGMGTVPLVAKALGRRGVGVDLSLDYCRVSRWRVNDPKQLAKVRPVPGEPLPFPGLSRCVSGDRAA